MAISTKESLALLRAKRAAILEKMTAYVAKEADGDALSEADAGDFADLKKQVDEHDARIGRLEDVQAAAIDAAEPVNASVDDDDSMDASKRFTPTRFNIKTHDTIRVKRSARDSAVGRYAVAFWHAKEYGLQRARDMVEKTWGDAPVSKALTLTTAQPIIPQDFSLEFIPLLTTQSAVRQVAKVMAMPNGNLTIPRQYLGSVGSFFGEGTAITATSAGFDNIQMTWHKMGALTYTTKEMLEFSPLDASEILTSDLANKLGLLEDNAFLNGNGTNYPIHGIISSAANSFTSSGGSSPTFQTVANDLQTAELNLRGNLVTGNDFVWIVNPYVKGFLKQLSSTYGVFPFKDEVNAGTLNGFRIIETTQLATNLGASNSNQTPIVLVKGSDAIIADAYRYALSMTTDGGFVDSSTQVNAFGQDIVAWKITNAVDFSLRHNVSACVINAVGWTLGNTASGFAEYDASRDTQASTASSAVD